MKIGVSMLPTDYSISPADLAVECEERGLESLWIPEHSHIPAALKSEWPGGPEMPKQYLGLSQITEILGYHGLHAQEPSEQV
jgi:alkanesulfonate monooxygenase SsuD/methylene tetrahydromethanopterin reductase-like flavin-dependent oxidoreductase (luciferase family)